MKRSVNSWIVLGQSFVILAVVVKLLDQPVSMAARVVGAALVVVCLVVINASFILVSREAERAGKTSGRDGGAEVPAGAPDGSRRA